MVLVDGTGGILGPSFSHVEDSPGGTEPFILSLTIVSSGWFLNALLE